MEINELTKVDMFDHIISVGDVCARIFHYSTLEIVTVKSLCEKRVIFTNGSRNDYDTVVSLSALGISEIHSQTGCTDALGNEIHEGDVVLYIHSYGAVFGKGTIISTAKKKIRVKSFDSHWDNSVINIRPYYAVISLSKYGLDDIEIKLPHWAR